MAALWAGAWGWPEVVSVVLAYPFLLGDRRGSERLAQELSFVPLLQSAWRL